MANITGWGRGTWGEGAWNAPLAVEVTGVSGTTALGSETVVAQTVASVDFRDSLMATSFSPEFGLTVDGFVQDGQTISNGSDTEDITDTERTQDIVLAAEMDLPSSFSKASCIWETGGTGNGAWFGISEQSGAYFLRLRAGAGGAGVNTAATNLTIAQVAVTTLPQFFDGNTHTVAWGFDLSAGRAVIFIDGTLVADGTTSDGSQIGGFAGGAAGGFGVADADPVAGGTSDDGSTQFQSAAAFTGTIRSDLRMYKNEFFTAQTNSTQTGTAKVIPTGVAGTSALGNEVSFTNVVVIETGLAGTTGLGIVVSDGGGVGAPSGVAGTSALGNTTETGTGVFSVTGVAGTSALGNEEAAGQTVVAPTGVNATGAVGNTVETGTASFSVTGVAGTSALGDEGTAASSLVIETGLSATGAVGTVTVLPSIEVVPTGASSTGAIGDALGAGGAKVVEDALTGTVNLGDEAVSGGANVSVTGVSVTGSISSRLTTGTQDYTTFTITVASKASYDTGSYNAYYVNGVERQTLTLIEGQTYRFDQSDSSNNGHPLRFTADAAALTSAASSSLTQFTDGVTAFGTPGTSGAYTEITVPLDSPSLYYYCTNHSNMGNIAATFNSTVNVIGGNLFVPTGVSATNSVGEETISLVQTVAVSGVGLSLSGTVGTLAIEGTSVVSLTGVSGTGATGEEIIYSLIIPNQTANWVETAA